MANSQRLFDQLIAEALQQGFSGWDFSYLEPRWHMADVSWNYRQKALKYMQGVDSLLDMGTGGGEFLSSLAPLPRDTCATEGYAPNVSIARNRLEPLGVSVVEMQSEYDLPLQDRRFDLVINRHESFAAAEVFRVLKPGGFFVTQQVGGKDNIRLNELLQEQVWLEYADWNLDYALQQLRAADFEIIEQREEFPEVVVSDIGAVVYYLKVIPWQIADFNVEKYRPRLLALHEMIQKDGNLVLHSHRFYIEARKEG